MRYYETYHANNPYKEPITFGPNLERVLLDTIKFEGEGRYCVRAMRGEDGEVEDRRTKPGTFEYVGGDRVKVSTRGRKMNDRLRAAFRILCFEVIS